MILYTLPAREWVSGDEFMSPTLLISDEALSIRMALDPFDSDEKLAMECVLEGWMAEGWQPLGSFSIGQCSVTEQAGYARIGLYPGNSRRVRVRLTAHDTVVTGMTVENSVTVGTVASAAGFGSSGSVAVDAGSGTDRCIIGGVCFSTSGPDNPTITYNSSAMTLINSSFSANNYVQLKYQVAPTTGSHTLAWSADSGSYEWLLGGIPMEGVHQTVAIGTSVEFSDTSTNPTVTVTDSVTGDLVVDVVSKTNITGVLVVGSGQTQRVNTTSYGGSNRNGGMSTEPGASGSLVMDWTAGVISSDWTQLAVAVKQSAAAAASWTGWYGSSKGWS